MDDHIEEQAMMISVRSPQFPASAVGCAVVLALAGPALGQTFDDSIIAEGRLLYEETAGDVGCALCHGMEATGDIDMGAPYIRGTTQPQLRSAIAGGVPVMNFIQINQREEAALLAYLQYLAWAETGAYDPDTSAGKAIFQVTAGGVGCVLCHAEDGSGDVGPDIRGADPVAIMNALRTVPDMAFIELSDQDIAAVADYMRTLHEIESH